MRILHTLFAIGISIMLVACAQALPVQDVHKSGFLGADADKLHKGGKGEPALVYRNPNADWASYTKMLLDPVTFWRPPDEKDQGISNADAQTLTDYFYNLIYAKFSQEFEMVRTPQPHTLRAKVAITKAEKSHVALDVVSTIVPQLRAAPTLKQLVTGKPAFVGEAQIEVELKKRVP